MAETNPKTSNIIFQTGCSLALIGFVGGTIVGFIGGSNLGPIVGVIPGLGGFVLGLIIGAIKSAEKNE